jgi:hypothetical protein
VCVCVCADSGPLALCMGALLVDVRQGGGAGGGAFVYVGLCCRASWHTRRQRSGVASINASRHASLCGVFPATSRRSRPIRRMLCMQRSLRARLRRAVPWQWMALVHGRRVRVAANRRLRLWPCIPLRRCCWHEREPCWPVRLQGASVRARQACFASVWCVCLCLCLCLAVCHTCLPPS